MNTRYLHSLALLLLITLQSCWLREPDRFYPIPADAYAFIPYDANSSFRFQDSLGHVNTFVHEIQTLDVRVQPDCPECNRRNFGERYSITFRGDNPAVSIRMSITQMGYGGYADLPVVRWEIYPSYTFGWELGGPACRDRIDSLCHDSLVVQGKVYRDVMELVGMCEAEGQMLTNCRLWYNKAQGILKYRIAGNETWELLP